MPLGLEIVLGALGAAGSVTAAAVRIFSHHSEKSAEVTVSVQQGQERIEKRGVMPADEASRMLAMVRNEPASNAALRQ
jgi:ADP-glucose pyrophosphorylase